MKITRFLAISIFINLILVLPAFCSDYTNSIGMEFERIKAGNFMMGNDPTKYKATESDETPLHEVNISQDFFMGKYEVTQTQWKKVMGYNPSANVGPNLPVENIKFSEIQKFITELNKLEGTDKYRLPTEAEWEYSTRAGTKTPWYFGETESYIEEYEWIRRNALGSTKNVGSKKPNPWGLHDMHGNVKEVVSDYYHTQYYKYSPLQDPTGPLESTSSHVVRGGAYYNSPQRSRSSYRYFLQDDEREESIGFRVAFTASEDEKSGLSASEDELQKQNKIMESILKEKMDN